MKKMMRKLLAGALCAMLLGTTAFAAEARDNELESKKTSVSLDGVSYTAHSSLYVGSKYRAGIWLVADQTVDAGVMNVRAYLYDEDGKVLADTAWSANEDPLNFHYVITKKVSSSKVVYASGQYKLINDGGEYSGTTWCIDSEENTFKKSADRAQYDRTKTGETYGSLLLASEMGYMPDLIAAVGEDNISGYVRAEDFAPEFLTQEAQLAYNLSLLEDNTINLYDLKGNVIGSYELGVPATEPENDPVVLEKLAQFGVTAGMIAPSDLSARADRIQTKSYPKTEAGLTYGSLFDCYKVGYYPDLFSVVGENGVEGYVLTRDYNAKGGNGAVRTFPVYDLNGTVVDTFSTGTCTSMDGVALPRI